MKRVKNEECILDCKHGLVDMVQLFQSVGPKWTTTKYNYGPVIYGNKLTYETSKPYKVQLRHKVSTT